MPRVSTYLNFPRSTEQAFAFYRSVFGGEFAGPIHRFADIPPAPGQPPLAESDRNLVMHVELPILGGHVLMGTDAPESMGFSLTPGNNVYINLDDTAETDWFLQRPVGRGKVEMPAGDVLGRLLRQHHRSVRDQVDVQLCQQG
jgi:PhnB protein